MALLVGLVGTVFWPGLPMYDTITQYNQVLSGAVDDWHPPIMVRVWQLIHQLGPGIAPMFVLQVALYGLGFGLIVAALFRANRPWAGIAAGVIALSPLLLGWQMVVIKDTQLQGALLLASGILTWFRLAEKPIAIVAWVLVALLLIYATLLRANAVFITIPLLLFLPDKPVSLIRRGLIGIAAMLLALAVSPIIDHQLLGADESGVAKTQPLFDLAAIATQVPDPWPFTPAERETIVRRHCVKNYFWDPLGDPSACGPTTNRLHAESQSTLYVDLAKAVVAHPIAYARHRLGHWNSSERWLVPPELPEAGPPDEAEQNDRGLATPADPLMPQWQWLAGAEASTPLGWPILWTVVSLYLLPLAWRRRKETPGRLALALLASALTLEASFLVISIASDMRYHLWPMTASALALVLLSERLSLRRWEKGTALLILLFVIGAGEISRAALQPAPETYEGMIHAPSG